MMAMQMMIILMMMLMMLMLLIMVISECGTTLLKRVLINQNFAVQNSSVKTIFTTSSVIFSNL